MKGFLAVSKVFSLGLLSITFFVPQALATDPADSDFAAAGCTLSSPPDSNPRMWMCYEANDDCEDGICGGTDEDLDDGITTTTMPEFTSPVIAMPEFEGAPPVSIGFPPTTLPEFNSGSSFSTSMGEYYHW